MLIRVPDQSLIVGNVGKTITRAQATRASDGSYAFVYIASGKPVTIRTATLSGRKLTAYWYDPRLGTSQVIDEFSKPRTREFTPPSSGPGNDWVLVLDDAAMNFAAPDKAKP